MCDGGRKEGKRFFSAVPRGSSRGVTNIELKDECPHIQHSAHKISDTKVPLNILIRFSVVLDKKVISCSLFGY